MEKQDQIDFLSIVVFGKKIEKGNNLPIFCKRAYRDLCRTIQFNERVTIQDKIVMRDNVMEAFKQSLTSPSGLSSDGFDDWHTDLCNAIIKECSAYASDFSYGQAQKWVNMTLKYFYIFDDAIVSGVKSQLHVPVDRIVIKAAKKELGVDASETPWSKWNLESYNDFQSQLRKQIKKKCKRKTPIKWEYYIWNKSAEETPSEL